MRLLRRIKIATLDSLKTQWPLESVAISSGTGVELDSLVMKRISSLTLYLCCSMTIPSAFGAGGSLRRLVILENDALDMFVKMSNSGVTDPVQELAIASTIGCDLDHDPEDLFKAMSRCSALRSLDLAISVSSEYQKASDYARLLAHLPDTLEHFRFWGQPGMAENMNHWLECTLDPKWLSNLKSWSFNLDVTKEVNLLDAHEAQMLAQKLTDFMLKNRPSSVLASPESRLVPVPGEFLHCCTAVPRPVKLI